jgi:CHAT domain-containing protein
MAYLPLHAAGHHHDIAAGLPNPRAVLDRVISTYTLSIEALAYTRRRPGTASDHAAARALIVAPDDMPGVRIEVARFQSLLPAADLLIGSRANREAVLAALPRHHIAHFAFCTADGPAGSDSSYLLLHDHQTSPLTLATIPLLHMTDADLAYLSGCGEIGAPQLAGEALHATAAFQLAGYRHVIANLWPITDDAAARMASDFYQHISAGGTQPPDTADAAKALHAVTRAQRAKHPASPSRWAAFVHVGT